MPEGTKVAGLWFATGYHYPGWHYGWIKVKVTLAVMGDYSKVFDTKLRDLGPQILWSYFFKTSISVDD